MLIISCFPETHSHHGLCLSRHPAGQASRLLLAAPGQVSTSWCPCSSGCEASRMSPPQARAAARLCCGPPMKTQIPGWGPAQTGSTCWAPGHPFMCLGIKERREQATIFPPSFPPLSSSSPLKVTPSGRLTFLDA